MLEGWIVKALSGYYYVVPRLGDTDFIRCRARGIFKLKGVVPLVGDRVLYSLTENGEGTVDQILPRSSELSRPSVANAELAVLVFSVNEPALNLQLLDKFLVHTENAGLRTVICLTKSDLVSEDDSLQAEIRLYESIGYEVFLTSAIERTGLSPVISHLEGKISLFAGQSGVGKSSLLNALIPGLDLATNAISFRLGRGKHTTRHVELVPLAVGGVVADTPGFSQLDFAEIEQEELGDCFIEFRNHVNECKFRGCQHHNEPGCRVIAEVEEGNIAPSRYTHYLEFLHEIKDRKRRY